MKNGGLSSRSGPFEFGAPDAGYTPVHVIDIPHTLPLQGKDRWMDDVERSLWVRFDDGIYARAYVRMIAHGNHFVVFSSYLNPKAGSRNLEAPPVNGR